MADQEEYGESTETDLTTAMSGGEDYFVEGEGKKKSTTPLLLALLLVVGGVGGYMYFVKQGPAAASAATTATSNTTDAAKKTINEFLSDGGKDLANMESMLRNTESVVKQFLAYPTMTQVPLRDLQTNPFRFAPPPDQQAAVEAAKRARDELRQKAVKAASELRVESIMTGRQGGSAIINGRPVKAGDTVGEFTIEEVKQGSVIVRDANFRLELRLGD